MDFDALIIGGGAAGLSCALMLGSAKEKSYTHNKLVGILLHQKASHLQSAVINNALGITQGTSGAMILKEGALQLKALNPQVKQITGEKVKMLTSVNGGFLVTTNKNSYTSKKVVVAIGYSEFLTIRGLEDYIIPHEKSSKLKKKIQLRNVDHLIKEDLYVAGSLAGHRSQYAIACGSGASVATDILTHWNNGEHSVVHDQLE